MAEPALVTTPDFTGTVDQRWFLAPLGGPQNPINYLDRFPEEVYSKSIDSRLVKFMYALLGPAGIGWLRKNYLEARLKLEDYGIEVFDLDQFYGNPLAFGRILEEVYEGDPRGMLPQDKWDELKAKDAKYRSRALDFVNGARAGNTPFGMRLVARSGLGHEVEIVENYRQMYDQATDDILGLPKYGLTNSPDEFVVVPRHEVPSGVAQKIALTGNPTGGAFSLGILVGDEVAHTLAVVPYNAHRTELKAGLLEIDVLEFDDIMVEGGPLPDQPIYIYFQGRYAGNDVPVLVAPTSALTGGSNPEVQITFERPSREATEEVVDISPRDQYHLHTALERIKPVATMATFSRGSGLTSRQVWNTVQATSQHYGVLRYVTGNEAVTWPSLTDRYWIERATEREAPQAPSNRRHHYQGFHNIAAVRAYTEAALDDPDYSTDFAVTEEYASEHIGPFSQYQQTLFPFLAQNEEPQDKRTADRATADYAEPLTINATTAERDRPPTQLINGIYPTEYQDLPGVPQLRYPQEQFWASVERETGVEYLEIDLGAVKAVNYLYFEISNKPVNIDVEYDVDGFAPARNFQMVSYPIDIPSTRSAGYSILRSNPWVLGQVYFNNELSTVIYTRFLRVRFSRRTSPYFTLDNGDLVPFSIEVRNLRVGRNIS